MNTPRFAFFDVDNTLINLKSMFSFHDYWYQHWLPAQGRAAPQEYEDICAILDTLARNGESREAINRRYYTFFAGRKISEVAECAQSWFEQHRHRQGFFITQTHTELQRLQQDGLTPVLVSGSFRAVLAPIADTLSVRHILCTTLLESGQCYSGRIAPPQTIGAGKATAMLDFLQAHGTHPQTCWAFGDDYSDFAMLTAVGHGVLLGGNPRLEDLARLKGLDILRTQPASDDGQPQATQDSTSG